MPIEKWSENVLVVHLGDDPLLMDELQTVEEMVAHHPTAVVLDFAAVRHLNSSNIARLLKLRKQMISANLRLILCATSTQVWGTFLVTGLDKIFECTDGVAGALAKIQMGKNPGEN